VAQELSRPLASTDTRARINWRQGSPPEVVAVKFLTGHGERAVNVLVAVLLVASLAGPFVATAAAVPSGMVTIPDANVSEDVPVGSDAPINASRLEGNVMASEHAETLRVVVTTPNRASDYLDNGSVAGSSGSLTLVLKDDTHSEGRRVAIGAEAVRDALGYTPERVYGTHEDGSKWSRPVEYEAGMLVFEVPHFSSNSITFSGEVSINGTYPDGSTVSYEVSSLDSVSNLSVNVTGSTASEWDNETASGLSPSGSTAISLAGDLEPVGPNGGEPELYIEEQPDLDEGLIETRGDGATDGFDGNVELWGDTASNDPISTEVQIKPTQDMTLDSLGFFLSYTGDAGSTVDVYLAQETPDGDYAEGTLVNDGWDPSWSNNRAIVPIEETQLTAEKNYTVAFVTQSSDGDGTADATQTRLDVSAPNVWMWNNAGTGAYSAYANVTLNPSAGISSLSVSDGNGLSKSIGDLNDTETTTVPFDVTTSSTTLDLSGSGAGSVDVTLRVKERSQTVDPVVSVNGHKTRYNGTLADRATAQLDMNESWVVSGTNTIDISVGDGSLSADAPTPSVALNYTHAAADKQSVDFTGEKWRESYNVSKTFASDRTSATLTIPFEGNVVGIPNIEKRVNGGTWSEVSQDAYTLNDTTLTVDLGSVSGGDTVELRTTGRKVNPVNADITVVEPTVMGDRLDTKFRIDSWSTDAHISVGSTPDGERVHYVYKESWSNADPYSKVTGDGYNFVYLPAASSGDEARISTIPVRVNPTSGGVRLSVDEPRTEEPQFNVRPGAQEGDSVEFTYLTASDDTHYVLKSKTNDVVHDDGTANSPLTLEDDDSAETLVFLKDPVSSDSGVVGPVDVGGDSGDPLSSPTVVVIAWGLLTAGFYVMHRRIGGPSGVRVPFVGAVPFPGGVITAVGSVGSGLLILEFYSGRVSKALAGVIESVGPIAGIAAVGIVVWWAYNQFRGRPVVIQE